MSIYKYFMRSCLRWCLFINRYNSQKCGFKLWLLRGLLLEFTTTPLIGHQRFWTTVDINELDTPVIGLDQFDDC